MADNTYLSVVGFVQFEPRTREANGQDIRDFTVKPAGSDKLIRVTLWPEFDHAPVEVGDFVGAEGKFTRSTFQDKDTGESRNSLQISANKLNINGKRYDPADRDVKKSASDEEGDLF